MIHLLFILNIERSNMRGRRNRRRNVMRVRLMGPVDLFKGLFESRLPLLHHQENSLHLSNTLPNHFLVVNGSFRDLLTLMFHMCSQVRAI